MLIITNTSVCDPAKNCIWAPLSINKPTYLVNVKFQNRFHKIF